MFRGTGEEEGRKGGGGETAESKSLSLPSTPLLQIGKVSFEIRVGHIPPSFSVEVGDVDADLTTCAAADAPSVSLYYFNSTRHTRIIFLDVRIKFLIVGRIFIGNGEIFQRS